MKTLIFILKYIHYFITSKNEHSIHGPFSYNFIKHVIKANSSEKELLLIENLRKKLCKNNMLITITDFGAGSNINNTNKRTIQDIAKNSAKNKKFGKLLYRIIKYCKPKNIIEIGTSLGISTCYLAKANTNNNIFTFEGCPETAKIAKQNFAELNIKNVTLNIGNFNLTLREKLLNIKNIDFAFIDGNHQEEPTINYFTECLKYSNNNTVFVFDDIHWSKGMENAWKYIVNHPKTTVTIDLFFVGIVFLKSELSKEHFKIRF